MIELAAVIAVLVQDPATGGWRDLRWGMEEPAAIAAAGAGFGRLPEAEHDERRAATITAAGPASAGQFTFTAGLGFYDGKLSGVFLTPPVEQCPRLGQWLVDLYGTPEGYRPGDLHLWRLPDQNTRIEFNDGRGPGGGGRCELRYLAIRHSGNAGL